MISKNGPVPGTLKKKADIPNSRNYFPGFGSPTWTDKITYMIKKWSCPRYFE